MSRRLNLVPRGALSPEYELQENGTTVGTVELRHLSLREMGSVSTAGSRLVIWRESVLRARYSLGGTDGTVHAIAERRGLAGTAYEVQAGSTTLLLKKKALSLHETYVLSDASGETGRMVREKLLSRSMAVELDGAAAALPGPLLLFLAWLALEIRTRGTSSG